MKPGGGETGCGCAKVKAYRLNFSSIDLCFGVLNLQASRARCSDFVDLQSVWKRDRVRSWPKVARKPVKAAGINDLKVA